MLDSIKTWVEVFEALVTGFALIAAGIWSYLLFVRQRQRFPRAAMAHRIVCFNLTPQLLLVHVTVVVENVGTTLIRLLEGHVQVQQLRPLTTETEQLLVDSGDPVLEGCSEVDWPVLGKRECNWKSQPYEIEPSETDEFHFDFCISAEIQVIEVYSYLKNALKRQREIGWNHTTIIELNRSRFDSIDTE